MTVENVFLGLGSNLGDSRKHLQTAIDILANHSDIKLITVSSLYHSQPMGPQNQPRYTNAVCQISTTLTPHELLTVCQAIETKLGRKRDGNRWGPRELDIDILLFGEQSINTPELTIPHIGMAEREFVLVPLFEIAPSLIMGDGHPLAKWVSQCSLDGLQRLR